MKQYCRTGFICLVIFMVALQLGLILFHQSYFYGYDGYYYAVQAQSLIDHGRLRIPDDSWLFWLMRPLAYFVNNGEAMVKTYIAVSFGLFLLAFYLLLKTIKNIALALIILYWITLSPSFYFMTIEFPKQFTSWIILVIAVNFMYRYPRYIFVFIGFSCLAVFFHKSAIIYIGLFSLSLIGYYWSKRKDNNKVKLHAGQGGNIAKLKWQILIAVTLLSVGLIAALVSGVLYLGLFDFHRFQNGQFQLGLIALLSEPFLPLAIKLELLFCGIWVLGVLFFAVRSSKSNLWHFLPLFSCFLPSLGQEAMNFGERIALAFPLLVLFITIWFFKDQPIPKPKTLAKYLQMSLLAVALMLLSGTLLYRGVDIENINQKAIFKQYDALMANFAPPPMLIVNRDMHYYYKYKTGGEAFSFMPERHWDKTRIWRLVYGVNPTEAYAYWPEQCDFARPFIQILPVLGYLYMREDCYQQFRDNVAASFNQPLAAILNDNDLNPSMARPQFLYNRYQDEDFSEFPALPPSNP